MSAASTSKASRKKTPKLVDLWDHNRIRTFATRGLREQAIATNIWLRGTDARAALGEDPWRSPERVLADIESGRHHVDLWDASWAITALQWYQKTQAPEHLLHMGHVALCHERWSWAVSSIEAVAVSKRTKTGVLLAPGWETAGVDDETLEEVLHTALQFEMEVTGLNHLDVITMEVRNGHAPRPRVTHLMRSMKDRESTIAVAEAMRDWRWRYRVGEDAQPPDRTKRAQHPPVRRANDQEQVGLDRLVVLDRELAKLQRERACITAELAPSMEDVKAVIGTHHKLAWVTPARAADIDVDALADEWPDAYRDVLRRTKGRPRELQTFIGGIRR